MTISSVAGRRIKHKKDKNGKDIYFFERKGLLNAEDIANCAALAFHKALIGISELTLIDEAGNNFRFAKAIQTYYAVYHLFVCNMLLDDKYELRFKTNDNKKTYEVDEVELNSEDTSPDQWNNGRNLEQDLASLIQHSNIRYYCGNIRDKVNNNQRIKPYTEVLYMHFIKFDNTDINNCIPGLYEKMDYVRDRAIYRPTNVIYKDGSSAQTSYHVREEIESLPTYRDVYDALFEFYKSVLNLKKKTEVEELFIINLFNRPVSCSTEYANKLGYTWDALEKMGGSEQNKSVPSYLCQMMELFEPEESVRFFEAYWRELLMYQESIK